ncbi:MAG: DUF4388 domain-containing protein [Myxococcaceae bacterium]|nr:DUF4388 domain-containing protein [Myxococcaceae bacterium]
MRGLYGDFGTMPLRDVIVYLGNRRVSGILNLENETTRKQITLVEGNVVNASSNSPREYLGQFLINLGHITEDQFNKAYETQQETKVFLGRILVMIGAVKEETVNQVLSLKVRETLLEAFRWEKGSFAFEADKSAPDLQGLELNVPLLDVHKEGEFRDTAWEAIRAAFPKGNCLLTLNRENLAEEPRPGSLDERLFNMIEAGQTIDELILALHATDFFLYQRLYALYRLDAVKVSDELAVDLSLDDAEGEDIAIDIDSDTSDPLAELQNLLGEKRFEEALKAARVAHARGASAETAALCEKVEQAYLADLREELMSKRKVPTLKVAPAALKAMNLSAAERYLLSRVDGKRHLAGIVNVSPLRELEALAVFRRFISQGILQLD